MDDSYMNITPRQVTAVLFDLDDTLLDWSGRLNSFAENARPHVDKVYDYLEGEGLHLPERDQFFINYRDTVIEAWAKARKTWEGVNFSRVLVETFIRSDLDVTRINPNDAMAAYDWGPIPGVTPYKDAADVLDTLKKRGYKIGLITNSMFPMWMRDIELKEYNLLEYFDTRLTSGDAGYMKPHPVIYKHALAQLGTAPTQSVFVGDRPSNDIAGANRIGMISVWMNPPHLDHDLNGINADYTITSLSELIPILEAFEGGG